MADTDHMAEDPAPPSAPAPSFGMRERGLATLRFFLMGLVLLLANRALTSANAPRPTLRVVVPPGLSESERDERVDAAILIEVGIALGWVHTDPVIRGRLVANMRFARGEATPADAPASPREHADDVALFNEALRLDMHRSDLIVRRRLVRRAELMLASDVRQAPVDDEALLAFRDAHPERFRAPARLRYADLFLARQRHADALPEVVQAMSVRVATGDIGPSEAATLSDPLLYSPGNRLVSADEVARQLGGELAEGLTTAPLGTWAGPFESAFGAHFVWVFERREAALPSLAEARARIVGAYRDARRAEALQARLAALRSDYVVQVEVREGAP